MNFLRKIIRLVALSILAGVVVFYAYTATTDVAQSDVGESVDSYAVSCSLPRQEVIDLFSYMAAKAAEVPVSNMEEILLSKYRVEIGQASVEDFISYTKYKLQRFMGYDHEERIEQVAMKAGIQSLEEHKGKCSLSSTVFSLQKLENTTPAATSNSKEAADGVSPPVELSSELSEAAREAIRSGFVNIENPDVEACVDARIASIRKEHGEEYIINYQVHNEIAVQCGFNI